MRRRTWLAILTLVAGGALATPGSARAYFPQEYSAMVWHSGLRFSPGAGELFSGWALLYSTGSATGFVTTTTATHRLQFVARADLCDGAPVVEAAVDGVTVSHLEVDGRGTYAAVGEWPAGRHQVSLRYLNDHRTTTCDRNVRIGDIRLFGYADGTVEPARLEQEARFPYAVVDPAAAADVSKDKIAYTGDATTTMALDSQAASDLVVSALRWVCGGVVPVVDVSVDGGAPVRFVSSDGGSIRLPGPYADGVHTVTVQISGTAGSTCPHPVTLYDVYFEGVL